MTATDTGETATDTGETEDACPGWWDAGWSRRRRLVFDGAEVAEDLEAFTVLVTLDAATFDYDPVAPGGADLRFVDDDGTTVLGHHVERWDPLGTSLLWVRAERIDAGGAAHAWLYYGNDGASDGSDRAGSYDASYVGVWHLDEIRGPHVDAAAGIACAWQEGGGGTQDAAGRIGGASEFDGTDDIIECGVDQIPATDRATITAWVRLPLQGDLRQAVVSLESLDSPYAGLSLYVRRNDGAIGTQSNNGYVFSSQPSNMVAADQWAFLAVRSVRDDMRGTLEVSQNGEAWELIASGNTNDLGIEPGTPLALGKWPGRGANRAMDGTLDEVRISRVARSDAWVRAQYLSDTGALVQVEAEQAYCP